MVTETRTKLDNLSRLFGGTYSRKVEGQGRAPFVVSGDDDADAPLPTERPKTREERQREQLIAAKERERRQFERYKAAREHRLGRLQEAHPCVAKYLRALDRITDQATRTRKYDCDFDVAELACRYGLNALPSDHDRFFVFELTTEWLQRVGKRKGHPSIPEDEDLFSNPFQDTAMGELKTVLRLR